MITTMARALSDRHFINVSTPNAKVAGWTPARATTSLSPLQIA